MKQATYINGWFIVSCVLALFSAGLMLWIAEDTVAQSDSFFVTIDSRLNWGSIECYQDNPFLPSRPMQWDDETGLTEINHHEGMRDPLLLLVELEAMTITLVYTNDTGDYAIGLQCPHYISAVRKNVHLRSPQWGIFNWFNNGTSS